MAQTYTLEEAADRLGISPEDMKRRLKEDWKTLRSFRDGPTLRFRANDIDELARTLGAASDPALPLAPMAETIEPGSDDFKLPAINPHVGHSTDEPLVFGLSDAEVFSLSTEEPTPTPTTNPFKTGSDSDIRLDAGGAKPASPATPTEELAIDFSGPGSAVIKGGSSAKLSAPKSSSKLTSDSGNNLANPPEMGDSSEFELSLDADSDDFELQLNTDSSDEIDIGGMPKDKSGKPRAGESGVNLGRPADSGISLEKKGGKDQQPLLAGDDSDSDDFELSLEPAGPVSSSKLSGPKSGKTPITSDSDSEFELTLDDSSFESSSLEAAALGEDNEQKGDIFETDFEIPPMADESGSEAVAVEGEDVDVEQSDFELALNESDVVAEEETGSQVVVLEDEGEASAEDVDLANVETDEEVQSVSAVMKGVKGRKHRDEEEEEEEAVSAPAGAYVPVPWGPVPGILLLLAFPIFIIGGLMGYDLLHTMWGYSQPNKPSAPLTRGVADMLGMEVKDQ